MSIQLTPIRCCTQCSAIQSDEKWFTQDGKMAQTTAKLETCSRCHFDLYCSKECQRGHWKTHKTHWIAKEQEIVPKELDRIVEKVFANRSARSVISLDAEKNVISVEETPERTGKFCIDLDIEKRSQGSYLYLLCERSPLPRTLRERIEAAQKLQYGARDVAMTEVATEVMSFGRYDQAFDLVVNWVTIKAAQVTFFRRAAKSMIENGVPHDKIVQLGKMIHLTDDEILNATLEHYPLSNKTFACQLAKASKKPDYYLEIVFSALLIADRKEEAREILNMVTPAKRRDLEFYLR